jgi:hypothetical protein
MPTPQIPEIVNFTIVGNPTIAPTETHWLVPRRRRVDNAEPTVAQCAGSYSDNTLIIGTSVRESISHPRYDFRIAVTAASPPQNACDTAHLFGGLGACDSTECRFLGRRYGIMLYCHIAA